MPQEPETYSSSPPMWTAAARNSSSMVTKNQPDSGALRETLCSSCAQAPASAKPAQAPASARRPLSSHHEHSQAASRLTPRGTSRTAVVTRDSGSSGAA